MNVLIDTSVWVDHFRSRNDALVELVGLDLALTHPMVIGELACGSPPAPRGRTLRDIGLLRPAAPAPRLPLAPGVIGKLQSLSCSRCG